MSESEKREIEKEALEVYPTHIYQYWARNGAWQDLNLKNRGIWIAGATAMAEKKNVEIEKLKNDNINWEKTAKMLHEDGERKEQKMLDQWNKWAETKDAELERVKAVLQRIHNPIKRMQDNLQKGETINGEVAIQLSKDAEYLKSIAFEALTEYQTLNEPKR